MGAIRVVGEQALRQLDAEPRLAAAPWPGQGEQPGAAEQLGRLGLYVLTPEKAAERAGHAAHGHLGAMLPLFGTLLNNLCGHLCRHFTRATGTPVLSRWSCYPV